jgi:hypothetical protein
LAIYAQSTRPAPRPADALAQDFLRSLSATERAKANLPFADENRLAWNFVPMTRKGIPLGDLTPAQHALADALLKASLSDSGYRTVEEIRNLEDLLFRLENQNPIRDKTHYYYTVYGEPGPIGQWGWRYEGHHVSLNFTYRDRVLIASTPQFLGSNPAESTAGRPLRREQELGFALLNSLSPAQQRNAVIAVEAPSEIITGNQRQAAIQSDAGIRYAELDAKQKKRLMDLVRVYADVQSPEEERRRLQRIKPETLVFSWMGSTKPGAGHYYRIQGSQFLIEFDNTQNNANHIHAVWRDFHGDFGLDALADHYANP